MQAPIELRIAKGVGLGIEPTPIPVLALFFTEQAEVPDGWQLQPTTHYLDDGTPAIAYLKYFAWNVRIVGELGSQHITSI